MSPVIEERDGVVYAQAMKGEDHHPVVEIRYPSLGVIKRLEDLGDTGRVSVVDDTSEDVLLDVKLKSHRSVFYRFRGAGEEYVSRFVHIPVPEWDWEESFLSLAFACVAWWQFRAREILERRVSVAV